MNLGHFAPALADYQWQLSLLTGVSILALAFLVQKIAGLIPTVGRAQAVNARVLAEKMAKPHYAANQAWNRKWSLLFLVVIFGGILPFCLTAEPQPWWRIPRDAFVILMVYDFFYYLTHRFVFHNGGWFEGPLLWMHAVHHRQHNPCRMDSSYIHPLEVAIGLGLYVATIFVLSRFLGDFHVVTVVVTWLAFTEINLHNHMRWEADKFPFRYMNYAAVLHHHHHARFTGGNFATISPLYDWMFGTLDHGNGYRAEARSAGQAAGMSSD
jgi:sterol desaturase/sphingolipid hydroxylase (fatty acid hydroxylase superfamily)